MISHLESYWTRLTYYFVVAAVVCLSYWWLLYEWPLYRWSFLFSFFCGYSIFILTNNNRSTPSFQFLDAYFLFVSDWGVRTLKLHGAVVVVEGKVSLCCTWWQRGCFQTPWHEKPALGYLKTTFTKLRQLLFLLFVCNLIKLINLFLAALGLRCCTRAFSSCGERGLLFVVVRGLLIAMASLVVEHGL